MTNEELAERIQAGEKALFADLWKQTENLFRSFCGHWWGLYSERFTERGVVFEDLMQVSFFALVDAVEAYDAEKGFKFTSYLHYPIQNRFNEVLGFRNNKRDALNGSASLDAPLDGEDPDGATLGDTIKDPGAVEDLNAVDDRAGIEQLRGALKYAERKCSRNQLRVFRLFHYSKIDARRAAAICGVSVGGYYDLLHRAHRAMRRDERLQQLRAEWIGARSYRNTGLTAFRQKGASSVELLVENMERKERRYDNRDTYKGIWTDSQYAYKEDESDE